MVHSTFRAAYAKAILNEHLRKKYNQLYNKDVQALPPLNRKLLPGGPGTTTDYSQAICIVGAGTSGLSAAVMLQYLGFTNVTVVEASSRIGGRTYTYQFKETTKCVHDYYDVGAMRIPEIDTQDSTFQMIHWLNSEGQNVVLKPYTYNAGTEPSKYEFGKDTSGFNEYMFQLLTDNNFPVANPPHASESFDEAFMAFIKGEKSPDNFSTRSWLMNSPNGPQWKYLTTQIAETFDTSTGLFDQAFMETICDWYDFYNAKSVKWKRVDGGMSQVSQALYNYAIAKGVKVLPSCPVIALADGGDTINVKFLNPPSPAPPTQYTALFNTTTFGCLQRMDLQDLNLEPETTCAIRSLSYDRATKVAIKFSKAWWQALIPNGGVSNSDLCISNVVYPSWDDGTDSAYTIIVSYSWAQDATRMSALIPTNDQESTDPTDPIIQLCLRDLSTLWQNTQYPQSVETLQGLYLAHHAFAWSHDPYTAGAFALFGPGQFATLYPMFLTPLCENKLSICGEAVSAHHAWISGAFDSSYNAIFAWCQHNGYNDALQKLKDSPFGLGEGQNTSELVEDYLGWSYALVEEEKKQEANRAKVNGKH